MRYGVDGCLIFRLQDVAVKVLTVQDFLDDQLKEFLREVCIWQIESLNFNIMFFASVRVLELLLVLVRPVVFGHSFEFIFALCFTLDVHIRQNQSKRFNLSS